MTTFNICIGALSFWVAFEIYFTNSEFLGQ